MMPRHLAGFKRWGEGKREGRAKTGRGEQNRERAGQRKGRRRAGEEEEWKGGDEGG